MHKIDWDFVEKLIEEGHTYESLPLQLEHFGRDKFHKAFKEHHGVPFGEYAKSRRKKTYYIEIDWDLVEKRYIQGCSSKEIALELGFTGADGLSARCGSERGMTLKEIKAKFATKGDNFLRGAQFKKAMEGDNSLLIFLGKNRLRQSEKAEEKQEERAAIINMLVALRKIDPSKFNTDHFEEE